MEKYFISMNMPSRFQMVGIAERSQTIEGQLNDSLGLYTREFLFRLL